MKNKIASLTISLALIFLMANIGFAKISIVGESMGTFNINVEGKIPRILVVATVEGIGEKDVLQSSPPSVEKSAVRRGNIKKSNFRHPSISIKQPPVSSVSATILVNGEDSGFSVELERNVSGSYNGELSDQVRESLAINDVVQVKLGEDVSGEVKIGTRADLLIKNISSEEGSGIDLTVIDDDEVDANGDSPQNADSNVLVPLFIFQSGEAPISGLLDIELSKLSETTVTEADYETVNFQTHLPLGINNTGKGQGLYELVARLFKLDKIQITIDEAREELETSDVMVGTQIAGFNNTVRSLFGFDPLDLTTVIDEIFAVVDAYLETESAGPLVLAGWELAKKLLEPFLMENEDYVNSLWYGVLWGSFTTEADGIGYNLFEFMGGLIKDLRHGESIDETFSILEVNLASKFSAKLDTLEGQISSENFNGYALFKQITDDILIPGVSLIPAENLVDFLVSFAGHPETCTVPQYLGMLREESPKDAKGFKKSETDVTSLGLPEIQIPGIIFNNDIGPVIPDVCGPQFPDIYEYLTTTPPEEIKKDIETLLKEMSSLLDGATDFSGILANIYAKIESGDYSMDNVVTLLMALGLLDEEPEDSEAFKIEVLAAIKFTMGTSKWNDGHVYATHGSRMIGIYWDNDDFLDLTIQSQNFE